MTDAEIAHNCIINKTYQNKIEFIIEIGKISDKKLITGLLIDLSLRSHDFESDKDQIMEICAELITKNELEDTKFLIDSVSYYKELIGKINKREILKHTFFSEFYSKLMENLKEHDKYVINETDVCDMFINNKEYLGELKENLIKSELYEIIPLVEKYI